jgi:hypothetical protein
LVNPDVITVTDANGSTATVNATVVAGSLAINLSPSSMTIGEEGALDITLFLNGAQGTTNIFSSDIPLITVTTPTVTGSTTSAVPVTIHKTTLQVCATTVVTITAIDSAGAKAETQITIEDHGNNSPAPSPLVCP